MFLQVITGHVNDANRLRRQLDRWMEALRPGASGWLGHTAGVIDDGTSIALVRFENEAAARANSDRPEQGEWWKATETCFDGPVTFLDSDDVELERGGGSDDAGFVQVMRGTVKDRT